MLTLNDKLNIVQNQLEDILKESNPYNVKINKTDTLPSFGIAIINISYDPETEETDCTYLESNWYEEELNEPLLTMGYELDTIEVSIVNLTNKYNDPINEQLIIIA